MDPVFRVLGRVFLLTPAAATNSYVPIAQVAQSVEQRTENPRVGGSIPSLGTIEKAIASAVAFLICAMTESKKAARPPVAAERA